MLDKMDAAAPDTLSHLLSHGFIPPLISALEVVGPSSPEQPSGITFPIAIGALKSLLCKGVGYPWVEQALRVGLLNQIVSWGSKRGTNAEDLEMELLENVLPQRLVYYSVILQMKKAFADVRSPSSDGKFTRAELYGPWNKLKALLDERSTVLEGWEAKGRPSFMVCYNLECGMVTAHRNEFERCSGCLTATYCSDTCQRADWTAGHRQDCRLHLDARRGFVHMGVHHRDRAFLRHLLRMDYLRLRLPIAIDMVRFMAENPDVRLAVHFDYTRRSTRVQVFPFSTLEGSKILAAHSQRFALVSGRLVAHTLHIDCGSGTFRTLWPLWASTSEFYDGLKDIARTAKGLEDAELEPRVSELIQKTTGNGLKELCYC
ncbi:hypothetical protein FB45DRAFT_923139 [Roridomyces roridus]|uniref:MYND-type domain-containing protein n=1 Tax=Roridomyces roridus TaxID=1738132 RepID=A0AAD7FIU2_9AGAR|nr:hypothetical protein FB45DRAFT_923139 [Roridomyces roridus]